MTGSMLRSENDRFSTDIELLRPTDRFVDSPGIGMKVDEIDHVQDMSFLQPYADFGAHVPGEFPPDTIPVPSHLMGPEKPNDSTPPEDSTDGSVGVYFRLTTEQQQLVTEYAYLIAPTARTISHHLDMDEAIGDGTVGLCIAALTYDVSKGVPFKPYARLKIKCEIIDAWRKHQKVHRVTNTPRAMTITNNDVISLDACMAGTDHTLGGMLADTAPSVEEIVIEHNEMEGFKKSLAMLTPRERAVIVGSACGSILREVGREIGVTESGACRLRSKAVARIREQIAQGS
jgi:RNA polymerase sigma factor (sigma-70 family)